jgi:hypothetical protein
MNILKDQVRRLGWAFQGHGALVELSQCRNRQVVFNCPRSKQWATGS